MIETKKIEHIDIDSLMLNLAWLQAIAVCLIAIGFTAMYAPFYSSFAIQNIVGGSFLAAGAMFAAHAYWSRKWGRFIPEFSLGALYLICALLLVVHPFGIQFALTVILGAAFVIKGIMKVVHATRKRAQVGRQWMMAGGVISLLMGCIIGLGFTEGAMWMVGVFVGLDLVFAGLSAIMISHAAREALMEGHAFCFADTCFAKL